MRLFSLPDAKVFVDSSGTIYLSKLSLAREDLVVILVTAIHSVVSIFLEVNVTKDGQILETGKVSLMCHTFLELAQFSNGELFEDDDDEQDDENGSTT